MNEVASDATDRGRLSARGSRALKVTAFVVGGSLLLVVAGHFGPLRPLLARLGSASAVCPVVGKLEPQEIESQRAKASQILAGSTPAKRRFAGPFVILASSRMDVEAWASSAGVTCVDEIAKTALRCRDVPARALALGEQGEQAARVVASPSGSDVFVRFDPASKVVGFDVMRTAANAGVVASLASELASRIEREAGARSATHGQLDAVHLEAPGMRMASVEFRFSDYAADVSVSRLEERGNLVVREQYRAVSLPAVR